MFEQGEYRLPAVISLLCLLFLLVALLPAAFFTSGIFYGWASLYTLFLDAGVYSDLCGASGGGEQRGAPVCAEQKEKLTFIYTGQKATWQGGRARAGWIHMHVMWLASSSQLLRIDVHMLWSALLCARRHSFPPLVQWRLP